MIRMEWMGILTPPMAQKSNIYENVCNLLIEYISNTLKAHPAGLLDQLS